MIDSKEVVKIVKNPSPASPSGDIVMISTISNSGIDIGALLLTVDHTQFFTSLYMHCVCVRVPPHLYCFFVQCSLQVCLLFPCD